WAYVVGGVLGLLLLAARIRLSESASFKRLKERREVSRGNFFMLFASRARIVKYVSCILVGVPVWFVLGILVTFAPEMARAVGVAGPVVAPRAVLFTYSGIVIGN